MVITVETDRYDLTLDGAFALRRSTQARTVANPKLKGTLVNPRLEEALKALMHYYLRDISYNYANLSAGEKQAIDEPTFAQLLRWLPAAK